MAAPEIVNQAVHAVMMPTVFFISDNRSSKPTLENTKGD